MSYGRFFNRGILCTVATMAIVGAANAEGVVMDEVVVTAQKRQ